LNKTQCNGWLTVRHMKVVSGNLTEFSVNRCQ